MIYEITTTDGLTITQGMDIHHINMANIVDVAQMGQKVCLTSNLKKDSYCIDFTQGVTLNGVVQTSIMGFISAITATMVSGTYLLNFTNASLTLNVLTVNHLLNAVNATVHIFNDFGAEVTGQYSPTKVTTNQLTIDFGEAIKGTWFLVVTRIN